ncbi:MAG: aldose 1-epimerase [Planctomycetaceae bacterium]
MQIAVITDPVTGSHAKIAVALGFNCFEFVAKLSESESINVIDAADGFEHGDKPVSHSGIPLLFPFPNRIRSGRFTWDGQEFDLPESLVGFNNGNAIHGFALDRPWRVVEQTEASVTGTFKLSDDAPERRSLWPADAQITLRYSLSNNNLRADITVHNPDDKPLPWGFGTHAYFKLPLAAESKPGHCTIYAPVRKRWELEGCLPTGKLLSPPEDGRLIEAPYFDTLKLDDVYTDIVPKDGIVECQIIDEHAGAQVVQRCDDSFREIVAFTPPWTSAVCLEPYTCTTDAINLQQRGIDAGLQVLAPGASWRGWIEIAVGPVLC